MGNNQKQPNTVIEHPRFAKAKISNNKKLVLQYKMQNGYNEWLQRQSLILKNQDKNPLLIPKIQETHSENFCGTEKSINLIFDYYRYTLFEEIQKRRNLKLNFEQTQLWFLLYHLLSGSSILQKRKQKVGDIRPKNILIDDKGQLGIISTLSFPDELTNYYKSLYHQQKTYLAPEELAQLEAKVKYCRSDPVIAESFSIGLTILDAALLIDSEELYDCENITFKNYLYQDNMVAFKSLNLSPFFIKTILNLLQAQNFNRPTPGEVLAILIPYEKQILSLEQFVPDRQKSKRSLQQFQSLKF